MKEMEETGVTIQVLSTIPVFFNYWAKAKDGSETSRFFNDHIAETVAKIQNGLSVWISADAGCGILLSKKWNAVKTN